jgi:hypothetical protein
MEVTVCDDNTDKNENENVAINVTSTRKRGGSTPVLVGIAKKKQAAAAPA